MRWACIWLTQLVFYGLPWLTWGGRQMVCLDLAAGKLHVFGMVFWPQDGVYLLAALLMAACALFLGSALGGRLWCGFACPHTVYTEIFMWIENRIEGGRGARMRPARGARPQPPRASWHGHCNNTEIFPSCGNKASKTRQVASKIPRIKSRRSVFLDLRQGFFHKRESRFALGRRPKRGVAGGNSRMRETVSYCRHAPNRPCKLRQTFYY